MSRHGKLIAAAALVALAAVFVTRWVRSHAADAAGSRGMAHHANLRYDEALAEYVRASELDPGNWRWVYYGALVHGERGEAVEAAEALRRVVAVQPDHGLAWWRLGEAEFKQARYDAADAAYARAEADATVAGHARRGRARVGLARRGAPMASPPNAHATSSRAYTPPRDPMVDALVDQSGSSVFLLRQAAAIALSSDSARREQIVRRALEVDRDNPDVVYELGALLQQLRRPEEALPYFDRHLEMVDDDQQTLVQLGKCYSDLRRLDEAETMVRRALAIGDDAVGWYNLGFVMEQSGRGAEAEEYYRKALTVDPSHASSYNNLAALLAERGRLTEAMDLWRTVIRLNPVHADAHANMGAALAQQGRFEEALRYLNEALRLNPNHRNARANRDAISKSSIGVAPQRR